MAPKDRAAYLRRIARRRKRAVAQAEKAAAEKAKRGTPKKVTVRVGAVEATISAGPDKKLGTDDDTVALAKTGTANYSTMLVKQLRELAAGRGVPGYSKMTKANLVKALRNLGKN